MFNFVNKNFDNNQKVMVHNNQNSNNTQSENSNNFDNSISNKSTFVQENNVSELNKCNVESNNFNSKMLNNEQIETLQKARKDLIGEIDAIIEYDNHIHSNTIEIAKTTWEDIRNEELVHFGELLSLIIHLAPYQKELIESGMKEFEERLNKKNR